MPTSVDTTTKLTYLLPTGTFLTFQVLAPLSTNNGNCGVVEKVLTGVTIAALGVGCILTSLTDSYTAPDGKVYNGFITNQGLWVPSYNAAEVLAGAEGVVHQDEHQREESKKTGKYIRRPDFVIMPTDYINAALSCIAFLALTLFTDPVSSCFYPNLPDTVLKTVPVLLAAVLGFFASFSGKVRHGYGNSYPSRTGDVPVAKVRNGAQMPPVGNETRIPINDDGGHEMTKIA